MDGYTPGPWKVSLPDDRVLPYFRVYKDVHSALAKGIISIAEIEPAVNPGEREANARLVATAPELLDMLKKICVFALPPDVRKQVDAVIGRAEGR